MAALPASEIERVFRAEYGRSVAVLVRVFGSIDIAEDAVQDAFTTATQLWPATGLPPSPAGWIVTTSRNRALAHVDSLDLHTQHLFHAIRADLLRRLGRDVEAAAAYQAAIDRTDNTAERDHLSRNRQTLDEH